VEVAPAAVEVEGVVALEAVVLEVEVLEVVALEVVVLAVVALEAIAQGVEEVIRKVAVMVQTMEEVIRKAAAMMLTMEEVIRKAAAMMLTMEGRRPTVVMATSTTKEVRCKVDELPSKKVYSNFLRRRWWRWRCRVQE
jgi:hypothetical protein